MLICEAVPKMFFLGYDVQFKVLIFNLSDCRFHINRK